MVSRRDFPRDEVEAARAVLIELSHVLAAYRSHIVLVGGWVPEMLFSNKTAPHVGSLDVDLAVNHLHLTEEHYRTIRELLLARGYSPGKQPFIFFREVPAAALPIKVQVDFLAGEYQGTTAAHRHQRVQDMMARKARGCDLAFVAPVEIRLEGSLPDGGLDTVIVRVASIPAFISMKGMALADRMKEKDAWDIYYCLRFFPGGIDALIHELRPWINHGLIREGLAKIAEKFASEDHVGPKMVADFEEITDSGERARIQRDSYERVQYVLEKLDLLNKCPE